jgi:hypothetical protein
MRATACVASRAGATTRQIGDTAGMSEDMVARHCRFSDQRENAWRRCFTLERTAVDKRTKTTVKCLKFYRRTYSAIKTKLWRPETGNRK